MCTIRPGRGGSQSWGFAERASLSLHLHCSRSSSQRPITRPRPRQDSRDLRYLEFSLQRRWLRRTSMVMVSVTSLSGSHSRMSALWLTLAPSTFCTGRPRACQPAPISFGTRTAPASKTGPRRRMTSDRRWPPVITTGTALPTSQSERLVKVSAPSRTLGRSIFSMGRPLGSRRRSPRTSSGPRTAPTSRKMPSKATSSGMPLRRAISMGMDSSTSRSASPMRVSVSARTRAGSMSYTGPPQDSPRPSSQTNSGRRTRPSSRMAPSRSMSLVFLSRRPTLLTAPTRTLPSACGRRISARWPMPARST